MRGFIVIYSTNPANYLDAGDQHVIAAFGKDEDKISEDFLNLHGDTRVLLGVLSLEEIERHRSLILDTALEQGIQIDRVSRPG